MGGAILGIAGFRESLTLAGVLPLTSVRRALARALSLASVRAPAFDGRTGKRGRGKSTSSENRGCRGNESALIHPRPPSYASTTPDEQHARFRGFAGSPQNVTGLADVFWCQRSRLRR
jgi:hypothetical protein